MVSFVILRRKHPDAARPYRSPVGVPGAVVAGLLAALVFVGVMLNPDYRSAIVAIAVVYLVGLVAFALWGRSRLILSPEEEYAMTGGLGSGAESGAVAVAAASVGADEVPTDEELVRV
jgi:ethanolamine permease